MSVPLGPFEKDCIQDVDHQLGDLIKEVKGGKENMGRLFYIEQQLSILAKNHAIPDSVKQKLQGALSDLQGEKIDEIKLPNLLSAKKQVDDVLDREVSKDG